MKNKTSDKAYAEYLINTGNSLWKKLLLVQAPYYLNIKYMKLGRTLDIGCGIGRNLHRLTNSVGVDHNPYCIEACKSRGLLAFMTSDLHKHDEFKSSFDTLLLSHVVEHMEYSDAVSLLNKYKQYLKKPSRIVIITPQAAGYNSDKTHITYYDDALAKNLLTEIGSTDITSRSFPLPRVFGKVFRHNELISIGWLKF